MVEARESRNEILENIIEEMKKQKEWKMGNKHQTLKDTPISS